MPGAAAVEAEWRQRVGEEFDRLARFMKPEQALATVYPCYGPADSVCVHDVIHHENGTIVAVCRAETSVCHNRNVRREDLVIYRFDVVGLCRSIAGLLDVPHGGAGLTGIAGLYDICVLDGPGTERRSVVLLMADPDESPAALLEQMLGRYATTLFTCFVPTRARVTADVEMRATAARSQVIPCSDNLTLDDANRFAFREGAQQLQYKIQRVELPTAVHEPRAQYTPSPHCLLIDHDGERPLTIAEYQALQPENLDLFIDVTATVGAGRYRASRRNGSGEFEETPLAKNQAAALVELVVRRKALRPTELDTIDVAHPDKTVKKGRARVDVSISRYEWRAFKTLGDRDATAKRYIFNPPSELRYAVLRPLTEALEE